MYSKGLNQKPADAFKYNETTTLDMLQWLKEGMRSRV